MKSPLTYWKEERDYLRDNPNKLWFKRKLYGWGWTPATWQGWTVIGLYILIVFGLISILDIFGLQSPFENFAFASIMIAVTIVLIAICYKKGESPKWQWGRKEDGKF